MTGFTIIFFISLLFHQALYGRTDDKDISLDRLLPKQVSQNLEGRQWESLKGANWSLAIMDWQLATDPNSSDRYMDKSIVGTIKNNSKKKFSEIRIEFTVYDEEGNQIAIVSSNYYDFKPGGIWRFQIPVTDDVTRAKLNGIYVPSQNSSESTSNQEEIKERN